MKWVYIFVLLGAVLASPFFTQTVQLLFTGSLSRDNCYITVEGQSKLYHLPEIAELSIRITESSNTKTKAEVIADVVSSSNQVERLLKFYNDLPAAMKNDGTTPIPQKPAISHWAMESHTSGTSDRYDRYEDGSSGYWAETRFDVHIQDFDQMGRIVAELQQIDHLEMRDIEWSVSEDTAQNLQREARRSAIRDAKAKARDLASEASGMDGGRIKAVDISGDHYPRIRTSSTLWGEGDIFVPASAEVTGRRGNPVQQVNFVPEKIRMTHSVRVKFVVENWGSVWPFTFFPRFLFRVQPENQEKIF